MPAHAHSLGAEVGEDVSAVVFLDDAGATTHITRLACVAGWVPVAGANPVAGAKTRRSIGRHRRRRTASLDSGDLLSLEDTFAKRLVGQLRRFAGRQFLRRHQARLHKQFFQPGQPVFIISMPQIIRRVLAFTRMARHVAVPPPQRPDRSDQAEHALLPIGVEDGFLRLRLSVDAAQPMHAAQIVRAVHDAFATSCGDLARSTPIMEFRVTNWASCSSLQSSVPAGRSGNTRYRTSEVESQTRISTASASSVPNSFRTPRGSATARAR